jgi:hypothetical protein
VKYWLREIKWHRSDLSDRPSSGRPPLEDIDARILQVLEAEPWSSVWTIPEFLKIPASTVHLHLTTSLNMKSRHFKRIPHFLNDDLRAKRLDGAQTASRRPAGTREMPFSRSNCRRWDMGLPWHEARDDLACIWYRITSPCQKDNCKRKVHADRFMGNSRDRTLLLAPKR